MFKKFRSIRECIEEAFAYVSAYSSEEGDFNNAKDSILEEQIKIVEESFNKENEQDKHAFFSQREMTKVETERRENSLIEENELLKREMESLQSELRRNDYEYEVEIKV